MAVLIANDFSTYSLTDEEVIQGSTLTLTQKQVIQNKLSILASEKISLEVDTKDIELYMQKEASLKGAMDELRFMLDSSDASEEIVRARAGHATEPEI